MIVVFALYVEVEYAPERALVLEKTWVGWPCFGQGPFRGRGRIASKRQRQTLSQALNC